MAIDISKLTDSDKGREVVNHSQPSKTEWGRIVRWSDKYIWVRYHTAQWKGAEPFKRTGTTPEATHPRDLDFLE
jgi:hypothetical protein